MELRRVQNYRLVVASQVLSIAALVISFSWWVSFFPGILLMVAYQILCCWSPPKPYLFVLSLLSLVEAALLVYAGIELLSNTAEVGILIFFPFIGIYLSLIIMSFGPFLCFGAAVLWLAAGTCTFAFVVSGKHAAVETPIEGTNIQDSATEVANIQN